MLNTTLQIIFNTFMICDSKILLKESCFPRFLHEESGLPYFKLGPGAVVMEGRCRTTNAILFSSATDIAEPFLELLKV